MLWLPAVTLLFGVSRVLYNKSFLAASRISETEFLTSSTLLAAIVALVLGFRFGAVTELSLVLSDFRWLLAAGGYTVVATVAIWQFYRGFREESLTRSQFVGLLEPFFIFLLIGVVFPAERDLRLYLIAAVVLVAFAVAHFARQRVRFRHGERVLLLVAVLYGVEAVCERFFLGELSAVSVYLLRQLGLAVALTLTFGFHLHRHLFTACFWGAAGSALLGAGYVIALFESYQRVGVTASNVVLLAGPVLLSLWANRVRQEHEPVRLYVAGALILIAVAYSLMLIP